MPVASHAVKAGDARPVALQLANELGHAKGQFVRPQLTGARCGSLDEVGKAEAVCWEKAIMLRFKPADAEGGASGLAQDGPREARPKAIGAPGEIVASRRREDGRIDADEHHVQCIAQQVWKRIDCDRQGNLSTLVRHPDRLDAIVQEAAMKVGVSLSILAQAGRSDVAVYKEHLELGDLAEPLGFDSIFALEHHFTGYSMSPAPVQLLSYFAGRTKRVQLGTAVIVLPWHDPIRVAESIALLDVLCGGRCLFGFGRGAASVEYAGFRIPMEEARARFAESAQLIRMALSQPEFEWQGEYYQIPRTSIRPRPVSNPERRFFVSAVTPESAEVMAKLGFGMMVIMQNEWPKAAADIDRFREIAAGVGHVAPPPLILTNVSCADSRDEAHDRAMRYLGRKWDSIDNHYHFSDGHLAAVKGYEAYGKMTKTYAKMKEDAARQKATEFYVKIQIVGTPDDCIQQIAELRALTGTEHVIADFSYGGMPHEEGELNMRLFADRVVPVLQRDALFAAPPRAQGASIHEDVFAPA
jgi:alkanesulfonate monooxygenase SsuD/methylene tetrahydromethanopterin reductase-like flavin-dependent oxidoreductase (luciferase family)